MKLHVNFQSVTLKSILLGPNFDGSIFVNELFPELELSDSVCWQISLAAIPTNSRDTSPRRRQN